MKELLELKVFLMFYLILDLWPHVPFPSIDFRALVSSWCENFYGWNCNL